MEAYERIKDMLINKYSGVVGCDRRQDETESYRIFVKTNNETELKRLIESLYNIERTYDITFNNGFAWKEILNKNNDCIYILSIVYYITNSISLYRGYSYDYVKVNNINVIEFSYLYKTECLQLI